MKLQKILVPVDFSPCSWAAVECAADLARRFHGSVDLLHVWNPPALVSADAPPREATLRTLEGFAHSTAGEQMKEYLAVLAAHAIPARGRLDGGEDPRSAILRIAEDEDYDMVVMGTHGSTGIVRAILGGTAEKVVQRASCPVLTVHAWRAPKPQGARVGAS